MSLVGASRSDVVFLVSACISGEKMNSMDVSSFLPLILVFAAMYFFVIRPQSKKAKEHKAMLDSLQPKDSVITSGGLIGKVVSLSDREVRVELAPGVTVSILRSMVAEKVPAGVKTAAPAIAKSEPAAKKAPAKAQQAKASGTRKPAAKKPATRSKKS